MSEPTLTTAADLLADLLSYLADSANRQGRICFTSSEHAISPLMYAAGPINRSKRKPSCTTLPQKRPLGRFFLVFLVASHPSTSYHSLVRFP